MAEALSPNPKRRPPFASPTKSPFFLGSNDDKLERAQARARRKVTSTTTASNPFQSDSESDPCLGKDQILELFNNCVKLASENKINQKNTWELNLIDHLYEIIQVEEETDAETNFQKASCTLEAGVKIYSTRVDSVHSEAYKVLGGMNRVGLEDEQDHAADESSNSNDQDESKVRRDQKKLSPLLTLESSVAAINVKKFDAAFVVDPLYHQTSAQFDEGGAKGLLLNNLGVYANCRVLFDSSEVPGRCESSVAQTDGSAIIDLSFAKECIESMVFGMLNKTEISPSLSVIVDKFDKDNRRPSEVYSSAQVSDNSDNVELDGDAFVYDQGDEQASVFDEDTYDQEPNFPEPQDASDLAGEPLNFNDAVENERFEDVDDYLFLSLGFPTKQNAWAGPGHWKYRKVKDPANPGEENGSPKAKKTRKKKADADIEFVNALGKDFSHVFAPPKNPKSLLLPASRAPCNTKLPEDRHYQPENLVKLFLLPNVLCLGRRSGRKRTDGASEHADDYGQTASWDEEDAFDGGAFDDGQHGAYSDNEESSTLVSQPRQVSKIEVQYDKTSKQVDVHILKETLWDQIQKLNGTSAQEDRVEETISFKQVLGKLSDGCRAAASREDISPHLCFICLLHLANEHGLRIDGLPTFDDLSIHLNPNDVLATQ